MPTTVPKTQAVKSRVRSGNECLHEYREELQNLQFLAHSEQANEVRLNHTAKSTRARKNVVHSISPARVAQLVRALH